MYLGMMFMRNGYKCHPEHQSPQFSVYSDTSDERNEPISIAERQSQLESSVPSGLSVDRTEPASSTPISHTNILPRSLLQDRVPTVKYPSKLPQAKSSSRPLTSAENISHLNEKEKKKRDELEEKQKRKDEREQTHLCRQRKRRRGFRESRRILKDWRKELCGIDVS